MKIRTRLIALALSSVTVGLFFWIKNHSPKPQAPVWEPLALRIKESFAKPGQRISDEDLRELLNYLKEAPDNKLLRLLRARASWRIGNLELRIAAKNELQNLSKRNDQEAVQALMDLAFFPIRQGVFEEDILDAADRLTQHPMASPASKLRATDILLRGRPASKHDAILEQALEQVQHEDKPLLSSWLTSKGLHQSTLEIVSSEEARSQPELFQPRFQALLAYGDLESAKELLNQLEFRLNDAKRSKALAHLGLASRDPEAIPDYLDWAYENDNYPALVEAGRLALLNQRPDAALAAYSTVLRKSSKDLGQDECTQLLQLALQFRDSKLALSAAQMLQARSPYHPAHLNNLNWLKLIHGAEPKPIIEETKRTLETAPRNPSFISTLALAQLLDGDPDATTQTLRRRGGSPMQPSEKALLAAALFAQGKHSEAQRWSSDITEKQMLNEEWALLKPYLKKLDTEKLGEKKSIK